MALAWPRCCGQLVSKPVEGRHICHSAFQIKKKEKNLKVVLFCGQHIKKSTCWSLRVSLRILDPLIFLGIRPKNQPTRKEKPIGQGITWTVARSTFLHVLSA